MPSDKKLFGYVLLYIYGISVNTPDPMAFSITGSATNGEASVGTDVATSCSLDWITIPCATNTLRPDAQTGGNPTTCVDRICGMVFNSISYTAVTGADPSVPVNSKYYSWNSYNHNPTLPDFGLKDYVTK